MAAHSDDQSNRPTIAVIRRGLMLLAIFSVVVGYIGLWRLLRRDHDYPQRPIDLAYYDAQLFVVGADPLQTIKPPYPIALEIARFTAPITTVYALFEAVRSGLAYQLQRLRARLARGHVVVCGDGAIADTLGNRLRGLGHLVVSVRAGTADGNGRRASWPTIFGNPQDLNVLRAAGVHRARALYACGEQDGSTNVAVAFAAAKLRRTSDPLAVYVHVRDPELCLTLQARYLAASQPPGLRLDFFNIYDVAARRLFTDHGLGRIDGRPPNIVVVGATPFARAVIVEAVRSWRSSELDPVEPLPVTVVDPTARSIVDDLEHRYPFLRTASLLVPYDADLTTTLASGQLREPPERAFICHDDEEHALKTATAADRFWRDHPQSIVVKLHHLVITGSRADATAEGNLFDEPAGRLRVLGVVAAACHPQLVGDDLVGRLARAIHERYRCARYREGDTPQSNPSMVRWEELPPALQESNREQARDIGTVLSELDCVLVPRIGPDDSGLSAAELDHMAELEHERWQEERLAHGWRYADQPDGWRRLNPALREWRELPERLRRRSRDAVREWPEILSDVGFQIVHR